MALTLRKNKGSELTHDEMDSNLVYLATLGSFSSLAEDGFSNEVIDSIRDHILNGFPTAVNPLLPINMVYFGNDCFGVLSVDSSFSDVLVNIVYSNNPDFSFYVYGFDDNGFPYELSWTQENLTETYVTSKLHISNVSLDRVLVVCKGASSFSQASSALDIEQ